MNEFNFESSTPSNPLIRYEENPPSDLYIIPQENQPFLPGQLVPVIMSAKIWIKTFNLIKSTNQNVVGIISSEKRKGVHFEPENFHPVGTLCRILKMTQEDNQLQLLLEGIQRFTIDEWLSSTLPFQAKVSYPPPPQINDDDSPEIKAYTMAIMNTIRELVPMNHVYSEELKIFLTRSEPQNPSILADFSATLTSSSKEDLLEVINTFDLIPRLKKVLEMLTKEIQIAKTQIDIRSHIENKIQDHQRNTFLYEQLKYIQEELGVNKDDKTLDIQKFKKSSENLKFSPQAKERFAEEINKLSVLEIGSPEYGLTRTYLEWLTQLPWENFTQESEDIFDAEKILNKTHEGLKDIKDRILEFLATKIISKKINGSILLFVGPPGVGKTSFGKSIAETMKRKFYRISLGGLRDEAEIKGHRKTYIGAMPGKIIQAFKETNSSNPVILLDEIDKLAFSHHGDPASALLEVLDIEQHQAFKDNYLNIDYDISNALFICTANQTDTIPPALLDRLEVIRLPGYIPSEKAIIFRKHLLPKLLKSHGFKKGDIHIDADAIRFIIDAYAREAGIRKLYQNTEKIIRKSALQLLKKEITLPIRYSKEDIKKLLGAPIYEDDTHPKGIGVVTGLAWTAYGGSTLPIEVIFTGKKNPKTELNITGQLGDVMKESTNIALSHVMANSEKYGVPKNTFDNTSIHIHVPAGATPKDGPSAGITIASALLSLGINKPPKKSFALTGEITLTGQVFPVGGIREKLIAAKRKKIKNIILPKQNLKDFNEIPKNITSGIKINFVSQFSEVVDLLFSTLK